MGQNALLRLSTDRCGHNFHPDLFKQLLAPYARPWEVPK